jgi:hypothetical protein
VRLERSAVGAGQLSAGVRTPQQTGRIDGVRGPARA